MSGGSVAGSGPGCLFCGGDGFHATRQLPSGYAGCIGCNGVCRTGLFLVRVLTTGGVEQEFNHGFDAWTRAVKAALRTAGRLPTWARLPPHAGDWCAVEVVFKPFAPGRDDAVVYTAWIEEPVALELAGEAVCP